MNTLKDLFLKSTKQYSDCYAIKIDGKGYTYKELYGLSASIAKIISQKAGKLCAVLCDRNIYAYASILASTFANKTYIPFTKSYKLERSLEIFKESGAKILIVDHAFEAVAKAIVQLVSYDIFILFVGYNALPEWALKHNKYFSDENKTIYESTSDFKHSICNKEDNHDAYLLFTSGSTGKSKGVIITHQQAFFYVNNIIKTFQPTNFDKFSQVIDLTFDLSVHDMFVCWAVGACLYVFNGNDVITLYKFISFNKITFWLSTPSMAVLLLEARLLKDNVFPNLKNSFFCGEPLSKNLAKNWGNSASNSDVINLYGPTEATIAFTYYRWGREINNNANTVPIGKPFDGLKTALVDENLNLIEKGGGIGELYLSGIQVSMGYFNDISLSKKRFIKLFGNDDIWYKTGDLAYLLEDGNLVFIGRKDDQIQLRGCRVEKLELEILLRKTLNTEEIAVVPLIDTEGLVQGYVAFVSDIDLEVKFMINKCHELMPSFLLPTKIIKLAMMPKTPNGKIDYNGLKESIKSDVNQTISVIKQ